MQAGLAAVSCSTCQSPNLEVQRRSLRAKSFLVLSPPAGFLPSISRLIYAALWRPDNWGARTGGGGGGGPMQDSSAACGGEPQTYPACDVVKHQLTVDRLKSVRVWLHLRHRREQTRTWSRSTGPLMQKRMKRNLQIIALFFYPLLPNQHHHHLPQMHAGRR